MKHTGGQVLGACLRRGRCGAIPRAFVIGAALGLSGCGSGLNSGPTHGALVMSSANVAVDILPAAGEDLGVAAHTPMHFVVESSMLGHGFDTYTVTWTDAAGKHRSVPTAKHLRQWVFQAEQHVGQIPLEAKIGTGSWDWVRIDSGTTHPRRWAHTYMIDWTDPPPKMMAPVILSRPLSPG